ncbi:MAG: bifunctional adenosylcobinamide kinase/adenosylcobinamide-phosphate guanylyltransferase [Lachnospiraceae bacterium]|nr:bifunctional adenosylcobinamide kinase/adenosylcobinamide-phosphate guanylyltransferase [Lachnospiraceae bacterium]
MIFIFGAYASGKRSVAETILQCDRASLSSRCVWDVQDLVSADTDPEALANELMRHEVVIATETGMGVVPVEEDVRRIREKQGELNRLLAKRADTVIRVFCGIPVVLKGTVPC